MDGVTLYRDLVESRPPQSDAGFRFRIDPLPFGVFIAKDCSSGRLRWPEAKLELLEVEDDILSCAVVRLFVKKLSPLRGARNG